MQDIYQLAWISNFIALSDLEEKQIQLKRKLVVSLPVPIQNQFLSKPFNTIVRFIKKHEKKTHSLCLSRRLYPLERGVGKKLNNFFFSFFYWSLKKKTKQKKNIFIKKKKKIKWNCRVNFFLYFLKIFYVNVIA